MKKIFETLEEREGMYGLFHNNSIIAQRMKSAVRSTHSFNYLNPVESEAVDQILSKISRIVETKEFHKHVDSWLDIAGYATLAYNDIQRRLNEKEDDGLSMKVKELSNEERNRERMVESLKKW